jgi:hypothetical protein
MAPRKLIVVAFWFLTASVSGATAENFPNTFKAHDSAYSWRETYSVGPRPQWRVIYFAPNKRIVYKVGERKSTCYSEALIEFAWYTLGDNGCESFGY